ncbi:unnamed protein product [Miscanthus lutarioriparius]|uniref:DNA topoisomerase (ATP-hydrolyzing) n=1 Tax=Miscanthus lutarioriparius TaxID=422564 RepID=A0A811QUI9_9POAL|nr:unnamed protein product [Miscanthus lutarioriparius]
MTHLEDDVVSLMRKRVIDMAGTLGETVNVELNGKMVPVKNFSNYVNWICEKVNDQWEVCVSLSEGQFQQVSFVNGIATTGGGSHVDYVTNQIATYVIKILNMKMKNVDVDVHNVKNHLWVFVNVLFENPAFDSQTKDTLTTDPQSFGSKCEFSDVFLKKVVNSGVIRNMLIEKIGGR